MQARWLRMAAGRVPPDADARASRSRLGKAGDGERPSPSRILRGPPRPTRTRHSMSSDLTHPADDEAAAAPRFVGGLVPHGLLPHHLLSRAMLRLTRSRLPAWKNWQTTWFVRRFGVDMSEAVEPDPRAYEHFNAFFTRALRDDARPLATDVAALVSPADGVVSHAGQVREGTLLQAKGCSYDLGTLLGDADAATRFAGGSFATVYLSPRDYHRVHMPLDGTLTAMHYVPGRLFSVNARTVARVPRLFTRNERVASLFETPSHGALAVVLIGAMFVGCMEQTWCGVVTPPHGHKVTSRRYAPEGADAVHIGRGEEMGRFNMGSTVIVVTERRMQWSVRSGDTVRVRAAMGSAAA